jgi:hypothetical protein
MSRCLPLLLILMLQSAPIGALAAAVAPVDRLFLTPLERFRLERMRQQGSGAAEATPRAASVEPVTLDGYVRNSQGKATAWFNQKDSQGRPPAQLEDLHGTPGEPLQVALQRSGRRMELKVGQTFDPATGTIRERYQGWPR